MGCLSTVQPCGSVHEFRPPALAEIIHTLFANSSLLTSPVPWVVEKHCESTRRASNLFVLHRHCPPICLSEAPSTLAQRSAHEHRGHLRDSAQEHCGCIHIHLFTTICRTSALTISLVGWHVAVLLPNLLVVPTTAPREAQRQQNSPQTERLWRSTLHASANMCSWALAGK